MIELNKKNAEKTLIIFYESWCPHCQKLLPEIYNLYKNQKEKKFEVIAVSIDTARTDWLKFIKANNLDWINVSDIDGWNGQSVTDYYIYATPTIFLIDRERKVISIPKSVEEVNSKVK
jgi:thiol-disulfide isomerase/thioredoxin